MIEELRKLYNTMASIETKGINSIRMADCLRFTEDLIKKEMQKEQAAAVTGETPQTADLSE